MTKGEAKVVETDVVIFPMRFNQTIAEDESAEEAENKLLAEEKSIENDIETRFARLRKSLRKRSVSIL